MNYGYYNFTFDPEMLEQIGPEVLAIVGTVFAVSLMCGLLVALLQYVLRSAGMYTIARRRGIRNAWFAWIPVANTWLLGCISDQFQYLVKGKNTKRRVILLVLAILGAVMGIVNTLVFLLAESQLVATVVSALLGMISAGLSITAVVFHYIAMYDIYTSMNPANNVMFLVLSIFFSITEPFFIFCNRKKEMGMPPRRTQPPVGEPTGYQPPVEPWQNGEG